MDKGTDAVDVSSLVERKSVLFVFKLQSYMFEALFSWLQKAVTY